MVGKRPLHSRSRYPERRSDGHATSKLHPRDRRSKHGHGHPQPDEETALLSTVSTNIDDDEDQHDRALVTRRKDFKDAAHRALAEQRRRDLKRRVLEGLRDFDLERYRKSDDELRAIGKRNKRVRAFYEAQNERLDDWLEVDALVFALADDVIDSMNPDADNDGVAERTGPLQDARGVVEGFLPPEHREKRANDARQARWALNVNLAANVLMLAGKLVSLRFSPSLSLIASAADSALDLFCTLIIYGTNWVVAWRLDSLRAKYPVGRRRLEPIGVLVFSVIMVVTFVQILQESVTKLLPGGSREVAHLPVVAIVAMVANVVVKGAIGIACRSIKTTQVQALVQDCKTDVYFNTISLFFPFIGDALGVWWLDPVGAALLALYVIYDWADTCLQNVTRLTGSSVDDALQKKLMFVAFRFSPLVAGFKTLTAYYAGDGAWVELDVLFEETTSLPMAHDIAETLQYCYEGLQEVDRAFVTIDYSTLGPLGHANENA